MLVIYFNASHPFFLCSAFASRPPAPPPRDKSSKTGSDGASLWETACRALQSVREVRIAVEGELGAQAILRSEGATGPPGESDGESDLEISGGENRGSVEL